MAVSILRHATIGKERHTLMMNALEPSNMGHRAAIIIRQLNMCSSLYRNIFNFSNFQGIILLISAIE